MRWLVARNYMGLLGLIASGLLGSGLVASRSLRVSLSNCRLRMTSCHMASALRLVSSISASLRAMFGSAGTLLFICKPVATMDPRYRSITNARCCSVSPLASP